MFPLIAAAVGVGLLKAGLGLASASSAADRQRAESNESVRRAILQTRKTESLAMALGVASGVEAESGSLQKYLSEMATEHQRQLQWMRESGEAAASATQTAGMFQAIGDIGGSVFQVGSALNWGKAVGSK